MGRTLDARGNWIVPTFILELQGRIERLANLLVVLLELQGICERLYSLCVLTNNVIIITKVKQK